MGTYWFDTNVFLESKNRAYAFDIAPGFWTWVERMSLDGVVRSPKMVFEEIYKNVEKKDPVANWLRMMKGKDGFFAENSSDVAKLQGEVGAYAFKTFTADKASFFMRGADPWIIAHAGNCQGTVVTYESANFKAKVQIPTICDIFGVKCTDLYSMARVNGLKLVLES